MSSSVFTLTNRLNYLQTQVNGIVVGTGTLQEVIDNGDSLQGSAPLANQVITYDGTNVVWDTPVPPSANQTLQDVINEGDLLEGVAPALDQVIKYDGTNVVWADIPAPPADQTLQEVINVSDQLQSTAPTLDQVIKYDGTNVVWGTLPAPPADQTLQEVINVSDQLQSTAPTLDQVIKYDGTNVVWADLPAPPSTPSLQAVLDVNNTANQSISLSNGTNSLTTAITGLTSVGILNLNSDTRIDANRTINVKSSTFPDEQTFLSAFNVQAVNNTVGAVKSGVLSSENLTLQNTTTKKRNQQSATSITIDGDTTSGSVGILSSLTATGLGCQNKVTPAISSEIAMDYFRLKDATRNTTIQASGMSAQQDFSITVSSAKNLNICAGAVGSILNLANQDDKTSTTNIGNGNNNTGGVSLNNGTSNLSTTAIHNGTNSVGSIQIGSGSNSTTAITIGNNTTSNTTNLIKGNTTITSLTASLTTTSTAITQTYPSNTTALATTQYVSTAISAIPPIPDGSITTAKLADGSVTTVKIADLNVTTSKLADLNVTTAKLANDSVNIFKLVDGSVSTSKLVNGSVTTIKISDDSVTTAKLGSSSVTTAKISDGNVTNVKLDKANIPLSGFGAPIVEVSLGSQKITNLANPTLPQDGATKAYVDSFTIPDGSITTAKLAVGSVTNAKLDKANIPLSGFGAPVVEVSLGSQKITNLANPTLPQDGATKAYVDSITPTVPDGSITTAKLADGSVTTIKIADLNVTTAKIANSNVTDAKLDKANIPLSGFGVPVASVSLGTQKITNLANPTLPQDGATKAYVDSITPTVPDGSITTAKLADSSVTTIKIADLNITTAKLADNSVTTAKILDSNVTNAKLNKAGIPLSGFGAPLASVSLGTQKITDLANPTLPQDGATKAYVDTITPTIPDGSITTAKLADLNVTTIKIADLNVTTAKLADSNVTTAKIANSNVTNAKLDKSGIPLSGFGNPTVSVSLGSQKITDLANPTLPQDGATKAYVDTITPTIPDGSITTAKLADGSVTTAKIANSNVTTAKIADANVTNAKLDKANIPLSGFGAPLASVSLGTQKIIDLANPTLPQDGATKAYVDASIPSLTGYATLAGDNTFTGTTNTFQKSAVFSNPIVVPTKTNTIKDTDMIILDTTGTATYSRANATFSQTTGTPRTTIFGSTGMSMSSNDTIQTFTINGDVLSGGITQSIITNSSGLGTTATLSSASCLYTSNVTNKSGIFGNSGAVINTNTTSTTSGSLTTLDGTSIEVKQKNTSNTLALRFNDLTIKNLANTISSVLDSSSLILTGIAGIVTYGLSSISANLNYAITTTGSGTLTLTSAGAFSIVSSGTSALSSVDNFAIQQGSTKSLNLGNSTSGVNNLLGTTNAVLSATSTATTQAVSTNNTTIATTNYCDRAVNNATGNFATKDGINTFTNVSPQIFTTGGISADTIVASTVAGTQNLFTTKTGGTVNIGSTSSNTTINGTTTSTGLITANGGLTMGGSNNITLGNGTVNPTASQLGFIGYSKNTTQGYFTVGMPTSVAGGNPYMYGVATLPAGVYMFSVYFAPGATTFARLYIVTGTTKPADPSATGTGGTTEVTFGIGNTPSNGGNGIITLTSGSPSNGEYTSFGMGTITTARPNVGISIGIAGAGAFVTGTYSFQYLKVG